MGDTVTVDSVDNAAHRVVELIENSIDTADVFNRLTQNGTTSVSGLGGHVYTEGGSPEFVLSRKIDIPEELTMQIRNMRSQFSMGLFTEITRAWVVIDSDIFMWNYETNDDLAYFDSVQNTVYKIALVNMKPGVFADHVNYGLAVGTVRGMYLYPMVVEWEGNRSAVSINPSQFFQIQLENQTINDIVSTSNGRIFFTADDKLFEFVYEHQKGWFRDEKKCRIVNQSSTLLSTLMPFFGSATEELEQISMDRSRHLLYCLGKNGSIHVFDLGADGSQCTRACAVLSGQIASQAHLLTQYGHEESNFTNIVSICALEAQQSNQLNLIAITSKGVRIYFSVLERNVNQHSGSVYSGNKNLTQPECRVQKLRVAHVRFAPGVVPASLYGQGSQGVSIAYADQGLCVMATANREVVCALSDLHFPHTAMLYEAKTDLHVGGNVWAIAPVMKQMVPDMPLDPMFVPRVLPHLFNRQPVVDTQRLIVCSNEAVHEFVQQAPSDNLSNALRTGGADGRQVADLLRDFGQTELLVLALQLLTSDVPRDINIKEKAACLFYNMKDVPRYETVSNANVSAWSPNEDSIADWKHKMRSPLFASTPQCQNFASPPAFNSPFSPSVNSPMIAGGSAPSSGQGMRLTVTHRHDALYAYFSRLMAPIWTHHICKIHNKTIVTCLSAADMAWLSSELRKLINVMEKYRLLPTAESAFQNTAAARVNSEAANAERQSLLALRKLVQISAETLSLWSIAVRHDLRAICAGMEEDALHALAARRFCQFVGENDHLNGDLIRSMIKYFLGDEAGTKELSDQLRQDCPTLYSADDACVTYAMEQLRLAANFPPGPSRRRLIDKACDMFCQSILKVVLPAVCKELIQLNGYDQVVSLCLLRAKRDDPKQLALIALQHGRSGSDDREMGNAIEKRLDAYRVLTDLLTELDHSAQSKAATRMEDSVNRDTMIAGVISSDDELAHGALFRWMLDNNKANLILESKSPYVEKFLTCEISSGGGQRYLDLLWRWYEKSGNYDKASKLLARLADSDSRDISLSQRFAYLAHSIICAKTSTDVTIKATIDDLKDKVEVAQIQVSIRDALCMGQATQRQKDAIKSLDGPILPLQTLLANYAVPFELHKLQLSIYHCAHHYDEKIICRLWESILDGEMERGSDTAVAERLSSTLRELYSVFGRTQYFPSEFLLRRILAKGAGLSSTEVVLPTSFYLTVVKDINMTPGAFLKLLLNEYRQGDPFWSQDDFGLKYIVQVALTTIESVVDDPGSFKQSRAHLASDCDALLAAFSLDARDVAASPVLRQFCPQLSHLQKRVAAL